MRRSGFLGLLLPFAVLLTVASGAVEQNRAPRQLPPLPSFLDEFHAQVIPRVASRTVEWISAVGRQRGYLSRPIVEERLPAILMISDARGVTNALKQSARDLASTGYVVLLMNVSRIAPLAEGRQTTLSERTLRKERGLAVLSSAMRLLRGKAAVDPARLGVIGWSQGAEWALALSANQPLHACVMCDGPFQLDSTALAGLKHVSLLGIWSGQSVRRQAGGQTSLLIQAMIPGAPSVWKKTLEGHDITAEVGVYDKASVGFMDPSHRSAFRFEDADQAWVVIYEFFGTHVEDASVKDLLAAASPGGRQQLATSSIADLMRTANKPSGLRGRLIGELNQSPDKKTWRDIRAQAALLTDTADLLKTHKPPRGTIADWLKQVAGYRSAAQRLTLAADRTDYTAARAALDAIGQSCGACHLEHR